MQSAGNRSGGRDVRTKLQLNVHKGIKEFKEVEVLAYLDARAVKKLKNRKRSSCYEVSSKYKGQLL